jgi:hypothetical protein
VKLDPAGDVRREPDREVDVSELGDGSETMPLAQWLAKRAA